MSAVIVRLRGGNPSLRWHYLAVNRDEPRLGCCSSARDCHGKRTNLCLALAGLQVTWGKPTCKSCLKGHAQGRCHA